MNELVSVYRLETAALGHLTAAVQFGFITGTLSFAFLTISDRFSPSRVFFTCALLGAVFNLGILLENSNLYSLLAFRFLTGFSLAGIYPVGMKIASDFFDKGLGRSLGFLVGALVLGTAFPHLLKQISGIIALDWQVVIVLTSLLALLGGLLIFFLVPDGPFRKKPSKPDLRLAYRVFRDFDFRAAAFGYFGHMWELYAFWAFVPVLLNTYKTIHPGTVFSTSLVSFLIIGLGGLACIAGGFISEKFGTKKTAGAALLLSGLCCLCSPLLFIIESEAMLIGFLIFWGLVVVADSPLFSTLVARNAMAESRGTALTIVNCIGFSITIFSIQLLNLLAATTSSRYHYMVLALGPALGLWALFRRKSGKVQQ